MISALANSPGYQKTHIRGRIIKSDDGGVYFDNGQLAKPEAFLEMIEVYSPNLPKIELNRRGPIRPGWDSWGNEAVPEAAE